MKSNLFESNIYFVDQKSYKDTWNLITGSCKRYTFYQIYNNKGEKIGGIKQISEGVGFQNLFYSGGDKISWFEIRNSDDKIEASISNPSFSFFGTYKYTIKDAQGGMIGIIKQKFMNQGFKIFNASKVLIYEMIGAKDWTFRMNDSSNNQIGSMSLNQKWSGTGEMKVFFTPTYKYKINIEESYSNSINKLLFLSGIIAQDMILPTISGNRERLLPYASEKR